MASVAAAVTGGATYYQQHPYASFPRRNSFSVSLSRTPKFHICCNPLPSSLSNLRYLGVFTAALSRRARRRGRARARRRGGAVVTYASLFGVGAPEALVIGVVALLVFGPKGLAEVARNLGKTLRAFQPTIRELQEVSREFKSTLEREIGLDEVQSSLQDAYRPSTSVNEKPMSSIDQAENGAQPYKAPYSSEDLLKITKEKLPASASGIQPQEIANSEVVEPTTVELPSFTLEIAPQVTTPVEEPTSASKVEPPTPAEASVEEKQDMAGI